MSERIDVISKEWIDPPWLTNPIAYHILMNVGPVRGPIVAYCVKKVYANIHDMYPQVCG